VSCDSDRSGDSSRRPDSGDAGLLHRHRGPDCHGRMADPAAYPRQEYGMTLLVWNDGSGLACSRPASVVGPDGKASVFWSDETCWGHIRPAPQKD